MTHELRVPGDKSISHRSLIIGALASGTTRIRGILESDDVKSTATVLRQLGVDIPALSADFTMDGLGLRGLKAPRSDLDCGNSGTTARLMTGVAAACRFESRFTGDESLSRRPMRRLARLLEQMGASFEFETDDGLPMRVRGGGLRSGEFENESGSAQIKSALLLAGLVGSATVTVREDRRSRDHTEVMLSAAGADVSTDARGPTVRPVTGLKPLDAVVPGDPSSAAFFAARAAMSRDMTITLRDVCLNPTRLGFVSALQRAGASVTLRARGRLAIGELSGDVVVQGRGLRAIGISGEDVPSLVDELPLIACIASMADGETRVTGAAELRKKESDRISVMVQNLRAIGADAEELSDGFVVRGSMRKYRGSVETHADHRIAMAFGILGSVPGHEIQIDDRDCVSISYPGFWRDLESLDRA